MINRFETDYIGKNNLNAHFCRCSGCNRLTQLYSYDTRHFVKFFNLPIIPLKRYHVLDECPHCGQRGITTARKFAKDRKQNLAEMMAGFASDADNPENCAHALHTLMVYNEASWFDDLHESYGLRFETNPQIQHIIAQGLCRFGEYEYAITHCRKAIVLGAGKAAEELMDFCHTLLEAKENVSGLTEHQIHPESAWLAYVPANALVALFLIVLTMQGVSSLRTYHAWLVNGSLQEYSFRLDGKTYTLAPGNRQQIKLKLGKHELQVDSKPAIEFDYTISLAKQLIEKNLLVINPDAMALLTMENRTNEGEATSYSQGKLIHELAGVGYPLMGFGKSETDEEESDRVGLFRPPTHEAMIDRLRQIDMPGAAPAYARKALLMDPSNDEADAILDTALEDLSDQEKLAFLQHGIDQTPPLLAWHMRYLNRVMLTQTNHTLVRDYTFRCKSSPEEPINYYLLGQVVTNRNIAHQLFARSEKGKGMKGAGFYASARNQFACAEFEKALASCNKALEKAPADSRFLDLRDEILLALRRFDDLVSESTSAAPEKRILYLTSAGYHQEAEAEAVGFSEKRGLSLPRLNAIRFYAVGNLDDYHTSLSDAEDTHVEVEKLLHKNRLEEADQLLSSNAHHAWWEHLVLYCAAMQSKKDDIAHRNLEKAVQAIRTDTRAYQLTARFLVSDKAPDPEMVRELDIDAQEKALVCAVLGYRFPEQNRDWFRLANTYNFYPAYPQRLLKKCMRLAARKAS